MGINTLNGKLKDMQYPYIIKNCRDKRRTVDEKENPNRDKAYWILNNSN